MAPKKHIRHLTQYNTPDESPGYLLWRVSIQWRSSIEKTLQSFDLTHPQFVILATLSWLTRDGKRVNQKAVGQMAGLDANTTSQVIRGLEKKQLVVRIASTADERSKYPTVTQRGVAVLTQSLPAVERVDEHYFEALNRDELKSMLYIFQKLMDKK